MSAQTEVTSRGFSHRLGIGLAVAYMLLAAVIYALIASQPPGDGLEWMPLVWLAMPWFRLSPSLLIPGVLLNAALLYGCGVFIQLAWRGRNR